MGSHILRQVVKAHPIAMLLGGSQTLCCHFNCKLVQQLVPVTGNKENKNESLKALENLDSW